MSVQYSMADKELLTDSLNSQKFITDKYNTFASECSSPQLRTAFMDILQEEHQLQAELFDEMNSKGWYQVQMADSNQISQTKTKFQNESTQG